MRYYDVRGYIINIVRESTAVHLWKNTASVIDWFKAIPEKEDKTFICFDIVEYYPSISEKLLRNALSHASQFVDIPKDDIEIIMHSRKSLLFENEHPWVKKDKDNMFDVTMGCWDGAEVCELTGAYILGNLTSFFNISDIGLYRDDGLAILKATSGSEAERIKKKIVKVFKDQGLRVTIQTNLKTVDFLDVTFNLPNDTFSPYRKPNDTPCYVNKLSNHPPTILQNIPDAINRRVASISSSEQVYDQAIPTYKEALKNSGYSTPISYPDKNLTSRKRQRKRKVIWFNPPFSKSVATNVAKRFICLVDKHFKKPSKLSKIFNRNTLKVSYSCMPNVASIITSHNKKILGNTTPDAICNCRVKSQCPMDGKCQERSIIYKAVVTSAETKKQYIGLTEHAFKQRYSNHQTSFRHQKYEQSTELSKHIWMLKKGNEPYSIAWEICEKTPSYTNKTKKCQLCLAEKLHIITADSNVTLNKRSELVSKCRHQNKFYLSAFMPSIT